MSEHREPKSGCVFGYDPGGNDNHGVAALWVDEGRVLDFQADLLATVGEVLAWFDGYSARQAQPAVLGLGVDTLLAWSTARSGYRPADRALRQQYPRIAGSIVAPNSLYGAMCLNGPLVARHIVRCHPAARLFETHPRVLYQQLARKQHVWPANRRAMLGKLKRWLGLRLPFRPLSRRPEQLPIREVHAFDAALSAYAALAALRGEWTVDLLSLPTLDTEALDFPARAATYPWPVAIPPAP